jgi:hypothetical protein
MKLRAAAGDGAFHIVAAAVDAASGLLRSNNAPFSLALFDREEARR